MCDIFTTLADAKIYINHNKMVSFEMTDQILKKKKML